MSDTSSANPTKLAEYSEVGLGMSTELRTEAGTVAGAVEALRRSNSPYLPANLGDSDEVFTDLADDWYHLDEFVGDVANGFFAANAGAPYASNNMVVTVTDDVLARLGQVGYADRDEAIEAAEEMAQELDRLLGQDHVTVEDIENFLAMADRGRYDPAFAVAFSEQIGVDGYLDAVGLIQESYRFGGNIVPDGLAAVEQLATVLTTALDTTGGAGRGDHHDPTNANLSDDQRLDPRFVEDLVSGYEPENLREALDLSVLMSYTDPPTEVAVDIANHRMTPLLEQPVDEFGVPLDAPLLEPSRWGDEYNTMTTNYARMLERNQDASARWLDGGENLELVLENEYDRGDGGAALAGVVENGLTHSSTDLRQGLMRDTINIIGGEQDEIRNDHLHGAFAAGVERNMDLVHDMVNGGRDEIDDYEDGASETDAYYNTHDFLREVLGDPDAASQVRTAVDDFVNDEVTSILASGADLVELERVSRTQAVAAFADGNATVGAVEERIAGQEQRAHAVDTAIGLVPLLPEAGRTVGYLDTFNDVAGAAETSIGGIVFPADYGELSEAQQHALDVLVETDLNNMGALAAAAHEAGMVEAPPELLDSSGRLRPLSQMSPEEVDAFIRWAHSDQMVGNDSEGPLRNHRSRMGTGVLDGVEARLQGRT